MLRLRLALAAFLVAILSLAGAGDVQARAIHTSTNQANLVEDGGFELPVVAECGTGYTPGHALGAWKIVGGVAGGVVQVTSCHITPSEGTNSVILGDGGDGGVSQALKTKAGTMYDLHFAVAGISNGQADTGVQPGRQRMNVLVNGKVVHSIAVRPSGNRSTPGWICPTVDYTATKPVSTLELLGTSQLAPAIDDVRVTKETGLNVSGVSPSIFASGTNLTAKIFGSGFTNSSKVSFSDKNIRVSTVQYVGHDQLNIAYRLAAGPAQTSDVTVANGGASDTCGNAVSVTANMPSSNLRVSPAGVGRGKPSR